jgi:hypothetical protein
MVHLVFDMMPEDGFRSSRIQKGDTKNMKKLMTIAIGLGLVLGLSTATFAQDKPAKKEKTTKAKTTKAPKTKSTSKM